MATLIFGLLLFLGLHSVRIVAEDWRAARIAAWGEPRYKALYSVLSLLGFVLIVWGFGQARETPTQLWLPPLALRHGAALLNALAFVLLAAAYVPGNGIKARLHHPMVLGVKSWAFAHLISNGNLAHVLLFGAFLLWAVADYASARRRDRVLGTVYAPGTLAATGLTLLLGLLAAAGFAFWLHGWLIGIKPLG